MSYVIRGPRGWVAKPGHRSSYTLDLRHARKFATRERAEKDRCTMNETIQDLEVLLEEFRQ